MGSISFVWLVLIQWVIALEWLLSGYGKFAKPDFMAGIGNTLAAFAEKTSFGFYADFLNSTASPNAQLFGNAVRISEIFVALSLLFVGLLAIALKKLGLGWRLLAAFALIIGAFLNLNFYLAAGWSSPSTAGINMIMGLTQAVLAAYYIFSLRESPL